MESSFLSGSGDAVLKLSRLSLLKAFFMLPEIFIRFLIDTTSRGKGLEGPLRLVRLQQNWNLSGGPNQPSNVV